jgi:hypothetical protein
MKRPPQFILGLFVGIALCSSFAVLRGQTASVPPPAPPVGKYQIACYSSIVNVVDTTSGKTWWATFNDQKGEWTPGLGPVQK